MTADLAVTTTSVPGTDEPAPSDEQVWSEAELRRRAGVVAEEILGWPPERRSSRTVIERLATAGLIHARWSRSDDLYGIALIEELARRGLTATAAVTSVHVESVLAMLRQFAPAALQDTTDAALAGTAVGCLAVSESGSGSDLSATATTALRLPDGGWRITGEKRFVTLATEADLAVVLARLGDDGEHRLGAFVVPRAGWEVVKTHRLVAGSPLATSWIRLDATVPPHHMLARPGLGLAVLNWGLTKERLAVAALVVGACRLGLSLAVTHAAQRHRFGQRLLDHQTIRLRLAELRSQLDALASHLRHLATAPVAPSRGIAGLKVTAARFGERCLSECMHVFGGDGYVEDATPLGRLWRDVRLARITAGTDEIMLELVAGGLTPDATTYQQHIPNPST